MRVFAILDNQVYGMSTSNVIEMGNPAGIPIADPDEYIRGSWDEVYNSAGSVVRSQLDVNLISSTTNKDNVADVLKCIADYNLTEIKEINPSVKICVTYTILDAFRNEVESKVSKTTIGTLKEVMVPKGITEDDSLTYGIAQNITGRVVIGAAFRELGISKSTRSESRIVRIDDVKVSISTTDTSIYSMYLSAAQTKIGWTPTSPTQGQVSEYDIPIFNLADMHPSMGLPKLPHFITIPERNDKVYFDINLNESLFAYTNSSSKIEDAIWYNQRKQMKYYISAVCDRNCGVEEPYPLIENLSFGDELIVKISALPGFKISNMVFKGRLNEFGPIPIGCDDTPEITSATVGDHIVVSWDKFCQNVEIKINFVDDSYQIVINSAVSPVIPPEPETPDNPDDGTITDPEEPTGGDEPSDAPDNTGDGTTTDPDVPTEGDGESTSGEPSGDADETGTEIDPPTEGDSEESGSITTEDPSKDTADDTTATP